MKSVIVAIDIGTTNVKCVIADRSLRMLAEYESEYPTRCVGVACFEQDCEDWWKHVRTALSGALARAGVSAGEAAVVAVSSQAPSMLPVDGRGRALRPAMIWMDRRSDAQC